MSVVPQPPPELTTDRLRLRPLASDDVGALVPVLTDPAVTRFFANDVPDRAAVRALVERRLIRPMLPGMGSWVVDLDGAVAGLVHLWPSAHLPGGLVEMGWLLGPEYWGKGLATEAAAAVLAHGRRGLGLPAVWSLVHRDNTASLAVARRLGMVAVGEGRYHGGPHQVFTAMAESAGALHHVELWVPDLVRSERSLGWLLTRLGWQPFQRWDGGASWRRGDTYVVVEASPDRSAPDHDRLRPGLNHLALHVADPAAVDDLVAAATGRGWRLLFADRHPYAGGEHQYAAYLEDQDGFEVELVADRTDEPRNADASPN